MQDQKTIEEEIKTLNGLLDGLGDPEGKSSNLYGDRCAKMGSWKALTTMLRQIVS